MDDHTITTTLGKEFQDDLIELLKKYEKLYIAGKPSIEIISHLYYLSIDYESAKENGEKLRSLDLLLHAFTRK